MCVKVENRKNYKKRQVGKRKYFKENWGKHLVQVWCRALLGVYNQDRLAVV